MAVEPRRARRPDARTASIVAGLRAEGWSVLVANAEVDLIVGAEGRTMLLEIKSSPKAKLTASQVRMVNEWRGHYAVVCTLGEAIEKVRHHLEWG